MLDWKSYRLTLVGLTAAVLCNSAIADPIAYSCTDIAAFNQIEHVTSAYAKHLASLSCDTLSLNGLRELSPETARKLAQGQGRLLMLNGLKSLDSYEEELTLALITFKGGCQGAELHLEGLRSINKQQAIYLSHFMDTYRGMYDRCLQYRGGHYEFCNVSPDPIKQFPLMIRTKLSLNGITSLYPESATELVESPVNTHA